MEPEHTNQLIDETSPYLVQHAHNPVDWHPWGEKALTRARDENKLIFLSIGYAACHWCHVMAHESFEDLEVAALLNRDFISIKVDREERPDLDEIYMSATMLYSGGHGGWPMSVFLAPDLKPVYAGTYFPKENQFGRPGFKTVLTQVAAAWKERGPEIAAESGKIVAALKQIHGAGEAGDILPRERVAAAADEVFRAFDTEDGGIPSGPNKFPPSLAADFAAARISRFRSSRVSLDRRADLRKNGSWRHLRSPRRRHRPLLDRRQMACPALRKNAL